MTSRVHSSLFTRHPLPRGSRRVILARAKLLLCACGAYASTLGALISGAHGAPYTVRLDYAGRPDCPDTEDFTALVSAQLGYQPFVDEAPDRVSIHIVSRGAVLEGRIEWRDVNGGWVGDQSVPMASKDCRRLARALAAALVVQIELLAATAVHDAATGPPKDTNHLPEASAPETAPRSPTTISTSPTKPRPVPLGAQRPMGYARLRPRPVFTLGLGASIGVGMSSSPIFLGRLVGSLAWQHLAVELDAEVSVPSTTRRADGAGFAQQHLLASAAGCALLTPWNACLLTKVGEVRMAGTNIDRPASAVAPVLEAGARVGIGQIFRRRFLIDAHADGLANPIRWSATLDRILVWSAPRFSAVIGVDAAVRFP